MRIVHMVMALQGGGLERIVIELVRAAEQKGDQAHIVCVNPVVQTTDKLSADKYTMVQCQGTLSMFRPAALSRVLEGLQPDIVHLHSGVWFRGAYASRATGIDAIVMTEHGRPPPDPWKQRFVDRIGVLMAKEVVAVSAPLAEYLQTRLRIPSRKVSVIPNGIRIPPLSELVPMGIAREQLGIAPDAFVIGSVGRLQPFKGYDDLVRAFADLSRRVSCQGTRFVLLLVGEGPERERLEQLASKLNVREMVRFLGWRADVDVVLRAMDIFAQPSLSEGTSIALLEAMAAGIPVVATAVGGTPDAIGSPMAGSLVPPADHDAMVQALEALLSDTERRLGLGRLGRMRVEKHHSLEAMANAYHKLYTRLAPQK